MEGALDTSNMSNTPAPATGDRHREVPDGMPSASPTGFAAYAWAVLALLLGLLLTGLAHHQQQRSQHAEWMADQRILADKGFASLQARLHAAEILLRSVQSLFLSSDEVTPTEFANLYANLRPREQFPSLQALAYARRELRPDGAHFITSMVAPLQGNEPIVGLDVGSQPNNLAGLLRGFESDQAVLSGPFRLRQQAGTTAPADGVTLRLPIYTPGPMPTTPAERSERARGSIAVSFRVGGLIGQALPEETRAVLRVRIDDITAGGDLPLYDSAPGRAMTTRGFDFDRRLDYGGRVWNVRMQSLHAAPAPAWPQSVLPVGVLASILLALLVFSLIGTRQRAIALAWRMNRRYRASEERFRALNEQLPALVLLAEVDDGRISYANAASRSRLGNDVDQRNLPTLFDDTSRYAGLLGKPGTNGSSRFETLLHDDQGERFWASVSISRVRLDASDKLLMVATDITEQRELTELLGHQASHDALTGLYNRREFERRLQHVLEDVGADTPTAVLLYIDLDQFKLINDTSGHLAGDQLLVQLAGCLRRQAGDADVLARIGGDEFGMLVTGLGGLDAAKAVAERVRQCIDDYVFTWENHSHRISASIGAVLIDQPGLALKNLLAQADAACYEVKDLGRNDVHFYSEHDRQATFRREEMKWADRLRWAVNENRLLLAFQEIHPLQPAPAGSRVELLLRYRDDAGQLVTPGAFMQAAEHYGLMPAIDRWVVQTALANFDRLHPDGAGLCCAAINLSGASLEDQRHADQIIRLLHQHRVEPSRVCFEITETMAARNIERMAAFIEPLRAAGCRIALDDFGTGMSSFTYLKNLPVDVIKIDGSFVRDLLTDPVSQAMVRAVADVGQQLGLDVVAEWVPDEATVRALLALGVQYGQGFKLHTPELARFQLE